MNQINQEQITTFLNGRDAQEGIITVECNNSENVAYVIYRRPNGEKRMKKEPYYPFLWLTKQAYNKLYKGDTSERDKTFREKGLTVRNLNIHDSNGKTNKRMVEGYNILVQAKSPMCFNTFQNIFKYAGVDIYERNSGIMRVTPVEQFLIQTGKRMFKGYEDYDNLVRLSFDLETDGLDPKTSKINQIGVRSNKGFEHIIRIDGENKEELRDSEVSAISQYWKIIKELKPDVICGYNSENFDHPFMFTRLEVNDTDIREVTRELYETPYKKKNPTILKLGGEMEYFRQTVIWGHNVTDALHAVRRAQAIDSNMKKADLKYITKYSKLNKSNRVYIPGDKINVLWHDTSNTYAFNDQNGDWYKIDDNHPLKEGYEGVIGEYIVERYLLDDLYETDKVELTYNQSNFLLGKMLPTTFGRVCTMGTAGTWKLILLAWSYEQGIGIPALDRKQDFVGGLSRLLKVGYVDRVVKLDYNSLYPSIILSYDIVSEIDITGVMNTLLEYMLTKREEYKDAKGAAGKKADKISDELKKEGLTDEQVAKLKEQLQTFKAEQNSFDKKQLPFKIFCNSFFGGFGAPYLFPWGDTLCAEATTCIGRQALRLMIQWFSNKGYTPIVGDTDGFNFQMPSEEELEKREYVGKGLNRNTVEGKIYKKVDADVAEFNDLFMRGKMGLGLDEYAEATINFARKNYADLLVNKKTGALEIKLVGNTIKSKRMAIYIEKFMDEGINLLLRGKGKEFIDKYYEYIDKIYSCKIPLREIASKGKIKKSLEEYKQDCKTKTKSGSFKARQAWYELAIKHELDVNLGDTLYYVNIGKAKSHADIKCIREKNEDGTSKEECEINFNCLLIDNETIESESDTFGEYNRAKYIDQFNKRIKPLIVCFSKEIRDKIIIDSPEKRNSFTDKECELSSGDPIKEEQQDTYTQLMTLDDKEINFWLRYGKKPQFHEEIGLDFDKMVEDYNERLKTLEIDEIKTELNKYKTIINSLTNDDIDDIINEGKLPKNITDFLTINSETKEFISKKYGCRIGSIFDMVEKNEFDEVEDTTE